jgi:amino acid adenylation domain-containing protein
VTGTKRSEVVINMTVEGTFSQHRFLHAAFASVAARYPAAVAVTDGRRSLTYAQLDARAAHVAAALRGHGELRNVGIYLDRSVDMVASILGVLMAGATYVPLDPTFPSERLSYLVEDSQISVIVSRSEMSPDGLAREATAIVLVDQLPSGPADGAPDNPGTGRDHHAPAYMIYTSGSTGVPKGVMVSHHNVLRLMDSTAALFQLGPQDVWTMFHSVGFDFSVWEMWGALLTGGRLVVVPYDTSRSSDEFYHLLCHTGTTVLNMTASAFRYLLPVCLAHGVPPALRTVIFGGEKLDMAMLRPWVAAYGAERVALVNMYGITEATVHATYKRLGADDVLRRSDSPIGAPLADLQIHVLDELRRPVALGQPGEMYIAGAGVALGYYRRPELTAQRFFELAASDDGPATRVYRTGDLVVAGADGELVYLARADDQMKVRGFRVEPEEIEACLNKHPDLMSSVVTVFDFGDHDERLVAYYVLRPGVAHAPAALTRQLRTAASRELPSHMRPSDYLKIDALPINGNGKLSRKLLVKPEKLMPTNGNSQFELQAKVYGIVTQILNADSVGKDDDFFDLGGTSLALLRVIAKINEQFGVKINMSMLANGASITTLADAIDQLQQANR